MLYCDHNNRASWSQSVTPDSQDGKFAEAPGGHNRLACADNMTAGSVGRGSGGRSQWTFTTSSLYFQEYFWHGPGIIMSFIQRRVALPCSNTPLTVVRLSQVPQVSQSPPFSRHTRGRRNGSGNYSPSTSETGIRARRTTMTMSRRFNLFSLPIAGTKRRRAKAFSGYLTG